MLGDMGAALGNLLYDGLRAFLWLVTRVFFRTVEVTGLAHVPQDGAVIFCGNHPNSLIDPVLITTSCGRRVRFAAKDTLFASPLLRVFLRVLGAVPIKRRQDHAGGANADAPDGQPVVDNSAAFEALFDVLRRGEAFGIFPEGISHSRSELAPLKTGAARIALGAASEGVRVRLVPCGLSYHRKDRLRGRVLVQFGVPVEIDEERVRAFREDPRAAASALTADIELALRALTINARDFDTLRVLDGVRRLYRPPERRLSLAERAEITRRFLDHYERLQHVPEIAKLYDDVAVYLFQLEALGLSDRDLTEPLSRVTWLSKVLRHLGLCLVLAPLALPGVIVHLPVIVLAIVAGEALTTRKDVVATTKMIAATFLTLLSYALVGAVLVVALRFPYALFVGPLVFAGLLLSGWATIRVLERQSVVRRGLGVLGTLLDLRRETKRLAEERERLRTTLLGLVDRYLDPDVERIVDPSLQAREPVV